MFTWVPHQPKSKNKSKFSWKCVKTILNIMVTFDLRNSQSKKPDKTRVKKIDKRCCEGKLVAYSQLLESICFFDRVASLVLEGSHNRTHFRKISIKWQKKQNNLSCSQTLVVGAPHVQEEKQFYYIFLFTLLATFQGVKARRSPSTIRLTSR